MVKRAVAISLAFIGVVVGAGFASGQEAMQYFVAFGEKGFFGVVLGAALMMITGIAVLQLGSYFQASEHTSVYEQVAGPVVSKILDWSTILTLFSVGFVMFAGGGSNLNQQFGWPVWIGAVAMLALVLLVGLFDVDRVTAIIGTITPFLIIFVVLATTWTIVTNDIDLASMNDYAQANVDTTLPNWWISALNYTGLNVMTAVSMSIVIGGNFLDNRAVGLGGIMGGIVYLVLLALLVVSLFVVAPAVNGTDMPVLQLMEEIHTTLASIMTFVVYGMVFNTAVGMFYALGKRLTRNHPRRFYPVFAATCIIGFILSFIGFQDLVGWVYPILGYLGIITIVVMSIAWLKNRKKLTDESDRRMRARTLVKRRMDPRERFTKKNQRELRKLAAASNMDTDEFIDAVKEEIVEELEEDDEVDFDPEDPDPSVVYVQHTEPTGRQAE